MLTRDRRFPRAVALARPRVRPLGPYLLLAALALFASLFWIVQFAAAEPAAPATPVDFVRDVQPIFVAKCLECHGPDTKESGFRLDRGAGALAGGDSGPAIVPGKSGDSLLVKYISGGDPEKIMPPDTKGLAANEVALIRSWIDQGANWPKSADILPENPGDIHWAYRPIQRPEPPQNVDAAWVRNPVDAFILARLNEHKITPSPEADRYTLIRRLSLDLIGLPPTVAEVDEFVNDKSPEAYERLVDRLLRSPHFGERWGRHWLDKARYADSDGYEKDNPRPDAWRWRDWVIDAINNDMPFDQFTIEQFAGDLLPNADEMQKLATAFNRQTLTNTEGGTDQEQFRVEAVFDRVETMGTVWLGLTVGCARCHSHKYDDIAQREYYQFFAFLNNGDEVTGNVRISDEALAAYEAAKTKHDAAVDKLKSQLETARQQLAPKLAAWEQSLDSPLPDWQTLKPVSASSTTPRTTFVLGGDHTILAGGTNPETATYSLVLKTDAAQTITGLRLETLSDKTLPAMGPGRVKHGNFVLNEVVALVCPKSDDENGAVVAPQPLRFARATADIEQGGEKPPAQFPASAAIDGKLDTGWAIAPAFGKPHTLVLELAAPAALAAGGELEIKLVQNHGQQHTIGKMRLSATSTAAPVIYRNVPDELPGVLALRPEQRTKQQNQLVLDYFATIDPSTAPLTSKLTDLQAKAPASPFMPVRIIGERTAGRRATHVLRRGDFLDPGVLVHAGGLASLHELAIRENSPGDRLDLARWLVSPQNPLMPRVAVNDLWKHLFGYGIVRTVNDFGVRGDAPTHPQLLDWLASEYQRLGWRRKAMIKTIVMSNAYRQSSAHRPELLDVDPTNRLLARQNRFRVEAEIVRDLSLAASGLLSHKVGGPSVFPPMPADVAALSYANNFKWNESKGEDRVRRGMYTFFKRTAPHPNMTTFDCPDSNTTCVERGSSNTPLQALTIMNNTSYVEAAQALGRRLLEAETPADADRLDLGVRLCVARPATELERTKLVELLAACREWYGNHPDDAKQMVGSYTMEDISLPETAAWVATARMLLNLDEFITRE